MFNLFKNSKLKESIAVKVRNKELLNKASNQSIDLRVGPTLDSNGKIISNGGYAIFYPANQGDDIRNHLNEIKERAKVINFLKQQNFFKKKIIIMKFCVLILSTYHVAVFFE